jgi:regulator of cell morphogenesis and NO signaling
MGETCGCGCRHGTTASLDTARRTDIGSEETVETVARRSSDAAEILRGLGIDTCCGGGLTLSQAAASAGVRVETVLAALGADRKDAK